jgi:hypothetical protein
METYSVSALAGIVLAIVSFFFLLRPRELKIPRIGPKPGLLGNTTNGYFFQHSRQLIEEGYSKVYIKTAHIFSTSS